MAQFRKTLPQKNSAASVLSVSYLASSITRYASARLCSKGSGADFFPSAACFACALCSSFLASRSSRSVDREAFGIISLLRSASLTASIRKLLKPIVSSNLTSIFVGCTFTSTRPASMVMCSTQNGNLCCIRYSL